MVTSHRELDLSFSDRMVLRRLRFSKTSIKTVREKYPDFEKYELVQSVKGCDYEHRCVRISGKGRIYLRYHHRDNFRFWFPVIVSILALFGGYDVYKVPVLAQLLQAIAKLAKTTSESLGAFF